MSPVRRLGRYELVTELARGGMAELHLGRLLGPAGFAKPLALKLILPHLCDDPRFVEMFLKEGRIAAQMSHPNICHVFELGEADGRLFLAMEYLDGVVWERVAHDLPDDPQIVIRAAVGAAVQACEGLHYAHQLRAFDGAATPVIHRDVSPQNLFVTVDGICKVLDFGVSKIAGDSARTRSGVIKGKLPYMAPEQISAEPLDGRTDMFALGVVLWEAIAKERLFDRPSDFLVWKAITEEDIPSVRARQPAVAPALDEVVSKALARDRADRFATMRDLADALRAASAPYGGPMSSMELAELVRTRCAAELSSRAQIIAAALAPSPPVVVEEEPEAGATASMAIRDASLVLGAPARSRWPVVAGLLAVASVIAVVMIVLLRPTTADRTQVATTTPAALDRPAVPGDAATAVPDAPAPLRPAPPQKVREPVGARTVIADAGVASVTHGDSGSLSVDVRPSAKIYIDGTYLDVTPIYRRDIATGKHALRIVRSDGAEKTIAIDVAPGKLVNLSTITW